eukprot:CAMPEP_0170559614 /NCGR_PEP_ID=MMETSP0211-20121228/43974_1 /TAXON_ID=311385 /ORGANISM="Pseudokeronopsis sp., Strain OXSARD2" /LENGTH=41 /DNA_ID= /DNA_START= /DNA_END= /DNA_ORIENTATION=
MAKESTEGLTVIFITETGSMMFLMEKELKLMNMGIKLKHTL